MAEGRPVISARHSATLEEIDALEDRLYEHNREAVGRHDGRGLGFAAFDGDGALIGGAAGYSWAGMAEISQLWVDERQRGKGLGHAFVEAFCAEAASRGCDRVFVMSYDFQAPALYEKCGFVRVAEIPGWPPGHRHVVLRLDLAPPSPLRP
jgi:GNAT superfamily N-acetyltransferase